MATFWDRVRIYLNSPTVVDLAQMLGVKRTTLSSWIHTNRRPPLDTLLKISELTGVSIAQLEFGHTTFFEDEVAENPIAYRREIDEMISGLREEELRLLMQLIPYLKVPPSKKDA
ncbi:MAG: helix-turn-helix transcriptional regulator [Sphaerochaeta sp.]|jgi:transcriptional regulator with XRE-family HTH domain|nr:helix-turn-helix domain-containing protein [Sphaerochaeta sp.]MDX9915128.1 helix-turn-helix transcriptional regulator [Sphaerochaeta sp.]